MKQAIAVKVDSVLAVAELRRRIGRLQVGQRAAGKANRSRVSETSQTGHRAVTLCCLDSD
jgi:uncharacterized small protein (DUF1192 family)